MKTKIILLTGSELRHDFFRIFIANDKNIEVLGSYAESTKGNIQELISKDDSANILRTKHLLSRTEVEKDFFETYCDATKDLSNKKSITKGEINNDIIVQQIISLAPDLIISYGCSIIKSELLSIFKGRFINIHLGLSPYYRGSGTNFWPFVNKELQCIGTTFMYIDEGIDTGEIIHQIRARIYPFDTIHQIGNRLIADSFKTCLKLIKNFYQLKKMKPISFDKSNERYYRKKDFSEKSIEIALNNLTNNLIDDYLLNKSALESSFPIIQNPNLQS